jgi:cytidylate kinase
MKCNVVAISRTLGAGGEDLGSELAKQLGFRYVDGEIIDRAAAAAGVSTQTIARAEARKPLIARILENMAKNSAGSMMAAGIPEPPMAIDDMPTYEQLIVDVIRETAVQGNVVIVAHGASIPLAGTPGLIRVMVTASAETRTQRVAAAGTGDADRAKKAVSDSDRARADYFRRFYRVDHELPTHYDMVLNTDVVDIDHAAKALLALAKG